MISPHTDDCEFGMGATITHLVASGCEITWVICSNAVKSLPAGLAADTLLIEQCESAKRLGISKEQLIFWDFEVREFPAQRQEILEKMVQLGRVNDFDAIFCPSQNDWHQDHMTISQETRRAFKGKSILGYDLPWNNFTTDHNMLVSLEENDIEKKIYALEAFESQHNRSYMSAKLIKSIARVRAVPLDVEFAEAFEVIRLVW